MSNCFFHNPMRKLILIIISCFCYQLNAQQETKKPYTDILRGVTITYSTDSLYNKGDYRGSIVLLHSQMDTLKNPRFKCYQLAQNYALLNMVDSAYSCLIQFMEVSLDDRPIYIDEDFEILRKNEVEWKKITDRIEEKYTSELDSNCNKQLAVELLKLGIYDQLYRSDYYKIKYKRTTPPKNPTTDKDNWNQLKKIVKKHGFPTISMVGKYASTGAFLILQHSHPIKDKYYYMVKTAYENKDFDPICYALLTDRWLIDKNKKQLYGTQSRGEDMNSLVLSPVEDFKNVNQRRKDIGYTSTIEEYCKKNNIKIPEEYYNE